MTGADDRRELLERYGHAYGEANLAVCFTETNNPDKGDPKKGRTGWPKTKPLPHAARGAALLTSQGQYRNPAIVSRPSGLIVVENDTPEGEALIRELELPRTVQVRTSEDWKFHLWYRPWNGQPPEKTSFRIEASGITAEDSRLFLCPPAIHPSGSLYTFVNSILDTPIASIEQGSYAELVRRAGVTDATEREQLQVDPDAKITTGRRRQAIFKFACMQRRWSSNEEEIAQLALIWNQTHCEPPLGEEQVRHQVHGAMSSKFEGGQEIVRIQNEPPVAGHIGSGERGKVSKTAQTPAEPEAFAWPKPPTEAAFHGAAGEFVETVAAHSEADPAALLAQYLAAAGNLFGTGCYYQVEGDQHPARLWVAIIGSTSKARKGTSWSRVRQVAADVDVAWAERITGGLSSGEGPVWAVRDAIYRQVKQKNEDGEDEFVDVLDDPGVPDKRLLVLESELSRIFDVIGRAGNTLSETCRRLWDGGVVSNLSKNSSFKATDPHVSVVGHISREELRRKIDDGEVWNGFCNRFILIAARRAQHLPFGGEVSPDDLALLRQRLGAAVSEAGQHNGRRISWNEPAAARWRDVYEQLSAEQTGMVGAVTARAEAHVVRLAVTYALLDLSKVIGLPHLEAALALWEFSERSAEWAFGDSTGDPIADEALQALRAAPGGLARTELRALFHNNVSSERLGRSLTVLLISGLARPVFEETGGRPRERWEVIA